LLFRLVSNNALESADDGWERMRSDSGTDNVVGSVEVGDPEAKSLVDSISESTSSSLYGNDISTEKLDSENV
jgi:hypothetical protein